MHSKTPSTHFPCLWLFGHLAATLAILAPSQIVMAHVRVTSATSCPNFMCTCVKECLGPAYDVQQLFPRMFAMWLHPSLPVPIVSKIFENNNNNNNCLKIRKQFKIKK